MANTKVSQLPSLNTVDSTAVFLTSSNTSGVETSYQASIGKVSKAILSNLTISDQTITGTGTDANIAITPNGTGTVKVPSLTLPGNSIIKQDVIAGDLLVESPGNITLDAVGNVNIISKTHTFTFDTDTVGRFIMPPSGVIAVDTTVGNGLNLFAGNVTTEVGNTWNFGTTGTLTLPDGAVVTSNSSTGVNILGGFNIHATDVEVPPNFSVDLDGRIKILVPVPDSVLGGVNIIGSSDGSIVPPQNFGVLLHQTGQQSTPSRIYNDGVGNYAAYVGRRYNGTSAAPTVVTGGQIISRIGATPYIDSTEHWPAISTARIDFVATETQSNIAQGSKLQMWATPNGSNVIGLVADFGLGGINLTGNLLPTIDNTYSLGNANLRWIGAHFGNAGIYIQDTTLGTNGQISLNNGIMLIDTDVDSVQVGNTLLTQTGLSTIIPAVDIEIGIPGDTGNTFIKNAGIKFNDGSRQTTAAIPLNYMANAFGVATLGSDSKVVPSQLPAGAVFFKGTWSASPPSGGTPALADGVGTSGWQYQCVSGGTVDFGSGPLTFYSGDFVIYNGSLWQRIPGGGAGVVSFNGNVGIVTLYSGDVTTALNSGAIVNSKLQNSNVTITSGAGLSGGGIVNLGGTITLTANVNNITAGTGVTVTPSSGNYTIAIGQPVGNANAVSFLSVVSNSTIQSTGNITGGNINTSNTVSAGGNIIGNNVTSNTLVTANNINATGNANFTGANVSLGAVANLYITGGTNGQFLTTNGGGIVSWANVAGANITGIVANANYAAYAGNVTIAGQGNITSVGTLTGLTSNGIINFTGASNVSLGSNANVHLTGGTSGQVLSTNGSGNLSWATAGASSPGLIRSTTGNTTITFGTDSLVLIYQPATNVTITLAGYAAGLSVRVLARIATARTINTGVAGVINSSAGVLTLPIIGAGGHNISDNRTVQLLYTCFDNTAANCYVAVTYF